MKILFLALALTACGHEYPKSSIIGIAPDGKPPTTQESIDLAMELYTIQKPDTCDGPYLDMAIEDRGLTTRYGYGQKMIVTIGPFAFASWAVLGSTLAHELEVHCNQNFTLVAWQDVLGLRGTDNAERDAYFHEVDNAKRFGLSMDEVNTILDTVNFYYSQ